MSEQERSERLLRRKERRLLGADRSLRMAHKAARAASWEWRPDAGLRWLDLAAARKLVGLPPTWTEDEQIPDWRLGIPAEDRAAFDSGFRRVLEHGEGEYEFRVLGADGEHHWMRSSAAVTERAGDAPSCISGVTIDVTAEKASHAALEAEVAERRRAEEGQHLLVLELNHRVKNMLATIQALARQSLTGPGLEAASRDFESRLMALTWTYEVLTKQNSEGASINEVLSQTLAPHADPGSGRILIAGPQVWLKPQKAIALAMAAHELATNAIKYGALSTPAGQVEIRWTVEQHRNPQLDIRWVERGGPPVSTPTRRGFGSRLVERSLAGELGGQATIAFGVEGVECRIGALLD